MKRTKLSIAITTTILMASSYADESSRSAWDEQVFVTGTTTEVNFTETVSTSHLITSVDIERIRPNDLPSLLGQVSGIDFRDTGGRGSQSGVFVRGIASNGVVILVDGIRSASATTGATALASIPVEVIDRIEIVKGPMSALYGADAMGGVIQIFTKKGTQGKLSGSAHASVGSFSKRDAGVSVTAGNDKHNFVVGVNIEDTDGYDRTNKLTEGNQDDDGFEEKTVALGAFFTLSDRSTLQLNYLFADNQTDFDNLFGEDEGRFTDNTKKQMSAKLNYRVTDDIELVGVVGSYNDKSVTPAFDSTIDSQRDQISLHTHFTGLEHNTFTLGVDYYKDEVPGYDTEERDNTGVLAIYQLDYSDVGVVASARNDDNEAYGSDTNFGLAVSYNIFGNTDVAVSYGTAFLAPTFNQLYFPNFGNPNLLPQESTSTELSLKGFEEYFNWRVSYYETDIENQIVLVDGDDNRSSMNIDLAEIEGVEFELNGRIDEFGWKSNISYSEARDVETGEYLDDRAVVSYNISLDYTFGKTTNVLAFKGEKNRYDRGGMELDSFITVDWRFSYEFNQNLQLKAEVNNLFDEDYTVNLASRGFEYNTEERSYELGIQYDF